MATRIICFLFGFFLCLNLNVLAGERPNIVYILADDLGYGDLSCLNPDSKIPTPNLDRLAAEGMLFTDAHSGSAVCTPTRYGILTGRYSWRSRLKAGVLWGYSPPLIEPGRMTVASLLKDYGYRTAGVGKWHLGLGWHTGDGKPLSDRQDEPGLTVDFSQVIRRAPTELGFDYFFGIPASLDMDPYVYIENNRVVELPTLTTEEHESGQPGFWRGGPIAPGFKHREVLPLITDKAIAFLEGQAKKSPEQPFFLYFALTAPHAPVLPNASFRGKSRAGAYGDFVVELDGAVGRVIETIGRLGLSSRTLVIATSDNGPERFMVARQKEFNHDSAHRFRGMKRDIWEGGHRIPFIARWPGKIRAGTRSDETICLTDLMATVADLLGSSLPEDAGEDSYSILPALLGEPPASPIREATVHHSSQGQLAIRQGNWKLCLTQGSGGNRYDSGPNAIQPGDPPMQLYNLAEDPGERKNLYQEHPEIVQRLSNLLERYKSSGRSTLKTSTGGPAASQPLSLHPENPHYFLFRGRPTVLITSAEHYGAVLNLDFDYVRYLETLQADGLNLTRIFTGAYVESDQSFKITNNTLAPKPSRFICPWARSSTPGYANGGNKFDLTQWDEAYFNRLRDFVAQAGRRGIIVEVCLFCPFYRDEMWELSPQNAKNNVNGVGAVPRTDVYTLDKHGGLLQVQERMVRKIVAELKEFDNVYYEVCNEPYFGRVTTDWHNHMADVIVDAEKDFPARHLISHNVANARPKQVKEGLVKIENAHPAISIFNFHYATPPDAVALNYGLNKAIGDNETGFSGTGDTHYRMEGWQFILAGGALYNNLDYSFTAGHEDGTFIYPETQPGGGSPALRRQLGNLKTFMDGFDFLKMKPNPSVVKAGLAEGVKAHALSEPGKQYAIYLFGAKETDLALEVPAGGYYVEWINPLTGAIDKSERIQHTGGPLNLSLPPYVEDIALRMKTK